MGRRSRATLLEGYGARLKKARTLLGLGQKGLAAMIDMGEFTLSRYENEVVQPDRCFLAGLEYISGIQRAWVESGIEPMVKAPASAGELPSMALLEKLEAEIEGEAPVKLVPYPVESGMRGMGPGDYLLLQDGEVPLAEGMTFLVNLAEGPLAGIARKAKSGWLLYHEADQDRPAEFPPTPIGDGRGIKVIAKVEFLGQR